MEWSREFERFRQSNTASHYRHRFPIRQLERETMPLLAMLTYKDTLNCFDLTHQRLRQWKLFYISIQYFLIKQRYHFSS